MAAVPWGLGDGTNARGAGSAPHLELRVLPGDPTPYMRRASLEDDDVMQTKTAARAASGGAAAVRFGIAALALLAVLAVALLLPGEAPAEEQESSGPSIVSRGFGGGDEDNLVLAVTRSSEPANCAAWLTAGTGNGAALPGGWAALSDDAAEIEVMLPLLLVDGSGFGDAPDDVELLGGAQQVVAGMNRKLLLRDAAGREFLVSYFVALPNACAGGLDCVRDIAVQPCQ